MIRWLMEILLPYDPDEWVIHPPEEQTDRRTDTSVKRTDNLRTEYHTGPSGSVWQVDKFDPSADETQSEWSAVRGDSADETEIRSAELTVHELMYMESVNLKLKIDKASFLKPWWAQGYGYETAAELINKDGFGPRTLSKYWKMFNNPVQISAILQEEGLID